MKDVAEAWRARGEPGKKGDWRCPGCQAKREVVPTAYWYCFLLLLFFFETYSKYLALGVSVIQPPNQNFSVLPPLIPVEAHALVSVRAVAVIHVLSSVIQDPVHHVELLHVPNVTVP